LEGVAAGPGAPVVRRRHPVGLPIAHVQPFGILPQQVDEALDDDAFDLGGDEGLPPRPEGASGGHGGP